MGGRRERDGAGRREEGREEGRKKERRNEARRMKGATLT